jgi:arylsulfatase A-like enzyme
MRTRTKFVSFAVTALGALFGCAAAVGVPWLTSIGAAQSPPTGFQGVVGRTYKESKPYFPPPVTPPKGAPNVLLVLLDDVGFGQASTFGGPIQTPNLEKLAKNGLRYNQFHTTALCSPTRAALLTGRNHHAVGSGVIVEFATGFDGYNAVIPKSAATVAEILKQNGYNTSAYGKWHNTPEHETSIAGPFDRWPTGMGFEYFYGFFGGDTNQWEPALVENTRAIAKPANKKNYHFTNDIADRAIDWVRNQQTIAAGKPFFMYFAPGACHAPHHAPREWIDKYKGKFDQGWDKVREETFARQKQLGVVPGAAKLTPRPDCLPAWEGLSADEKRLYARMQEVFAGFLSHADHEIGRVIDTIEELGQLDNTLVIYIVGDNGASGEGGLQGSINETRLFSGIPEDLKTNLKMIDELGGPLTYNHYPAGWAHAGCTPFQWVKQIASHFGGTRNPMVVSWPKRIHDRGGLRSQFHHVVDVAPTILEAAGIPAPAVVNGFPQKSVDGVSMVYTFDSPDAKSRRTTQYFEMLGNRAIYHDGWVAAAFRGRLPWSVMLPTYGIDDVRWELYHIDDDFSEADDLAAKEPQRLRRLQDLFWIEAAKNNVLPLDDRVALRVNPLTRPSVTAGRTKFTYYPGTVRLPEASAPAMKNCSYTITAETVIPQTGAEGMLLTQGGRFGGHALFVQGGKLVYVYSIAGEHVYTIKSEANVPPGEATLRFEFARNFGLPGAGGTGRLFINGKKVGEGAIDQTVRNRFSLDEGLDVGEDTGTPVCESYQVPFKFTGTLKRVTIELGNGGLTSR